MSSDGSQSSSGSTCSGSSGSACSGGSNSTHEYSHVPFAEFSLQVAKLCQTIFPRISPHHISVERLSGGSSNRVIGISLMHTTGNTAASGSTSSWETGLSTTLAMEASSPSASSANHVSFGLKAKSSPPSSHSSTVDSTEVRSNTPSTGSSLALGSTRKRLNSHSTCASIISRNEEHSPSESLHTTEEFDMPCQLQLSPELGLVADHEEALRSSASPVSAGAGIQDLPPLPPSPILDLANTVEMLIPYEEKDRLALCLSECFRSMASPSTRLHKLVLRIPRFDEGQVEHQVAVLRYLRANTTVPVPNVCYYDLSTENAISSPFMLQECVPGEALHWIYPKLSTPQKEALVVEYAHILHCMREVQSPVSGELGFSMSLAKTGLFDEMLRLEHNTMEGQPFPSQLDIRPDDYKTSNATVELPLTIRHFRSPWIEDSYNGTTVMREGHSTLHMLLLQFERHKAEAIRHDPIALSFKISFMERLSQAAREMSDLNCLGNDKFTLYHGDLAPRNIMCGFDSGGSPRIRAVLDWDEAIFAPEFMSCQAPDWIWAWNDSDDENDDEPETYETPTDPDLRHLKETFESLMGQKFLDFSYQPHFRLARQMFDLAMSGMYSNETIRKTRRVLSDWNGLRNRILRELGKDG